MLITHTELFAPVDLKRRVFRKVPRRARCAIGCCVARHRPTATSRRRPADARHAARRAFDAGARRPARRRPRRRPRASPTSRRATLFGLARADVGRPLQDLEISYRPVELRSRIEQALRRAARRCCSAHVEWSTAGRRRAHARRHVVTPIDRQRRSLGASVILHRRHRQPAAPGRARRAERELETAYEELQSTNEELETTNEELQSTNEELETTNEELQSTNEELETMNEELQSTNEELETINDELRQRASELDGSTVPRGDPDEPRRRASWSSTRSARPDLEQQAEELWGLRPTRPRASTSWASTSACRWSSSRPPIRNALSGESESHHIVDMAAVNRLGKPVTCRVTTMPLRLAGAVGAVLLMENAD